MFCEECGKKLPEGARFCENCGAPVHPEETVDYVPEEAYRESQPAAWQEQGYREQDQRYDYEGQTDDSQVPYGDGGPEYQQEPYMENQPGNPYGASGNQLSGKQKNGKGSTIVIVILSIVTVLLLAALVVLGIWHFGGKKSADPKKQTWEAAAEETTTEEAAEETSETETSGQENRKPENLYVAPSVTAEESSQETTAGVAEQEYILPDSNTAYLTEADLAGLTKEELRLARNELYARHGRKFKDEGLNQYFSAKSWYHPSIEPDQFNESVFNEYEIANRKLIADYEKKMGY
ncbi:MULTISPECIES: YARHG domain-containing protein [unclassified Candidatus Paralachnospira]|uniref:YARHG domain-containing protein n=1 Tax=unclassified Candidatus Paralachnospira TaxID=3099471 RepID=UPI003F93B182